MPLKKVLPRAEIIVLAEITSNDVKTVQRKPEKRPASVVYTCSIKARFLEEVRGRATKEMAIQYSLVVVQGVWLESPGSGLETRMKANEQYVLLLATKGDSLQLLRAEKVTELAAIKQFLEQPEKQGIGQPMHGSDALPRAAHASVL